MRESSVNKNSGIFANEGIEGRKSIYIPIAIFNKLGRDRLYQIHATAFSGSYPVRGQNYGDTYEMETRSDASPEQIQSLIEAIEQAAS